VVLKDLLVRESLDYGLASAETAFIATRSEPGKPIEETVVVANALPAGWSPGFAGYAGAVKSVRGAGNMLYCLAMDAGLTTMDFDQDDVGVMDTTVRSAAFMKAAPSDSGFAELPCDELRPSFAVLFKAVPRFMNGETILFDSTREANPVPDHARIVELEIHFADGIPAAIDAQLQLLIFVDDAASPRARVSLADIMRVGGRRPLNLLNLPGQLLRVVLADPAEAWKGSAPRLEVTLRYE
jgi:Ca-activated chloride channel homolog